ncbi:hypothetical protein KEM52_000207 [Ascosphaera acerosa]|nr:hypothetical protein KEM52_000207 [Ascosphaera acerosa]
MSKKSLFKRPADASSSSDSESLPEIPPAAIDSPDAPPPVCDDARSGSTHGPQAQTQVPAQADLAPPPIEDLASPEPDDSAERQTGLLRLDPEGHAAVMTASLLEFYCMTRAAELLNQRAGCARYDRAHPRVRALGRRLYESDSRFLSQCGVVAGGVESDDWAAVRERYRDSLDTIGQIALDAGGLTPSDSQQSSRAPSRVTSSLSLNLSGCAVEARDGGSAACGQYRPYRAGGRNEPARRVPLQRRITETEMPESAMRRAAPGIIELMASGSVPSSSAADSLANLQDQVRGFSTSRYLTEFREEALLGRGSYGAVYRAKHHVDGQVYAVKKIPMSARRLRSLQQRGYHELESILKEIRTLAKLDHRNVVRYFGAWVEYGRPAPEMMPGSARAAGTDQGRRRTVIHGARDQPDDDDDDEEEGEGEASFGDGNELSFGEVFDAEPEPDGDQSDRIVFADSESSEQQMDTGQQTPQRANPDSETGKEDDDEDDELPIPPRRGHASRSGESDSEDVESIPRSFEHLRHHLGHADASMAAPSAISEESEGEDVDLFSDGLYSPHANADADAGVSFQRQGAWRQGRHIASSSSRRRRRPHDGPLVTLHIQMSLHPLSLARYLAPPASAPTQSDDRHCYHLIPSLKLLLGILDGVQYLHSIGMVHRDLKPANIFLSHSTASDAILCPRCQRSAKPAASPYNTPRIGDFGLVAEITQDSASRSVSGSEAGRDDRRRYHRPVGTEFYRPPIVPSDARPGRPGGDINGAIDESLDAFALGVIFFELLYRFGTRMERMFVLSNLSCSGSTRLLMADSGRRATSSSSDAAEDVLHPAAGLHPMLPDDFDRVDHMLAAATEGGLAEASVLDQLRACILGLVDVWPQKRWTCEDVRALVMGLLAQAGS